VQRSWSQLYERIGSRYGAIRQPDHRLQARIISALGDAQLVLNVGAGTGNYEPTDRHVVAVEPSEVMTRQRRRGSTPVVRGVAEALPFADRSFGAALATFTVHHWSDVRAGLGELRRVSNRQVLLVHDRDLCDYYWITEYFPEILDVPSEQHPAVDQLCLSLDVIRIETLPIPADCSDGFCSAFWARPEALLDPELRAGSSSLSQLDRAIAESNADHLRADLASGDWDSRYGFLRSLPEFDMGYRLLIAGE
jgi:SAM-dependent methyltransferase